MRQTQCRANASRSPWQLFARGPLLTRDKDLSKLYACERVDTRQWHEWHSQPLELTRHAGNYFVPISIRPIFIFLLQKLCQITWLLTSWKIFLYFRRPRWGMRPVAFATSATWLIRHWANARQNKKKHKKQSQNDVQYKAAKPKKTISLDKAV